MASFTSGMYPASRFSVSRVLSLDSSAATVPGALGRTAGGTGVLLGAAVAMEGCGRAAGAGTGGAGATALRGGAGVTGVTAGGRADAAAGDCAIAAGDRTVTVSEGVVFGAADRGGADSAGALITCGVLGADGAVVTDGMLEAELTDGTLAAGGALVMSGVLEAAAGDEADSGTAGREAATAARLAEADGLSGAGSARAIIGAGGFEEAATSRREVSGGSGSAPADTTLDGAAVLRAAGDRGAGRGGNAGAAGGVDDGFTRSADGLSLTLSAAALSATLTAAALSATPAAFEGSDTTELPAAPGEAEGARALLATSGDPEDATTRDDSEDGTERSVTPRESAAPEDATGEDSTGDDATEPAVRAVGVTPGRESRPPAASHVATAIPRTPTVSNPVT